MLTGLGIAGLVLAAGAALADDTAQHSDSWGAAVSDTATTAKVKERLADDNRLGDAKISVTTNNGVVIFTGTAPSADASNAAEEAAEGVKGVKSVENQIAAPSKVREAAGKVTDDWITTRIKTEPLRRPHGAGRLQYQREHLPRRRAPHRYCGIEGCLRAGEVRGAERQGRQQRGYEWSATRQQLESPPPEGCFPLTLAERPRRAGDAVLLAASAGQVLRDEVPVDELPELLQ